MAASGSTVIQIYHSVVNGNTPLAANLNVGELAINAYNGKLYYKNSNTGNVSILADGAVATGNLPGGTAGSVVYQSATGVTAYLPIGAANSLLYSTGSLPAYATLGSAGSIVYTNGTAPTSLALGTNGYVLTAGGSVPQYVNPASLSVGTAATAGYATSAGSASTATLASTATNLANGAANQLVYQSGANTSAFVTAPTGSQTGYVLGWTGSAFAWINAPAATSATNLAGGAQYQIPFQSGVGATTFNANLTFNSSTNTFGSTNITASTALAGNTVASSTTVTAGTSITATTSVTGATLTVNGAITSSAATGAINYGTLSYSDVNIFSSYATSVNNYAQKIIQNTNSGSSASVDFIVSNNLGTASTYYGDFGMNSSTYTGTGPFQAPNIVYMYAISTDLVIGTKSNNYLRFVTNDNAADSITINPSNAVAFNGSYGTSSYILVTQGSASAPLWTNPASITVGTATNLAGGIASQIPYQSSAGTTAFIANGTAGQILTSNGTSAPYWNTLAVADNSLLWYFMG